MNAPLASAHTALGCALAQITRGKLLRSIETRWASASFSGMRHSFVFGMNSDAGENGLGELSEREFDLPGHIVADILLVEREQDERDIRLTIEALTVEDR